MTVRHAGDADHAAWDRFVLAHPEGTLFDRPLWVGSACSVFGHRSRTLLLEDKAGRLRGVLPLADCKGLLGGVARIAAPYSVYGGPLADSPEAREVLLRAALQAADEQRVGRLEIRSRVPLGPEFTPLDLYEGFRRALPEDPDQVLAGMPKKARADARRARKNHGLELEAGLWLLPDLVRLFQRNKQELGSPALPSHWFEELVRRAGDAAHLHVVRRGKDVLAAVLSFSYRDEIHAYYSGTAEGADREFKASTFLYCALQEWAIERGLRWFDFGRSRVGSGAHDFKRRQGFEAQPLPYGVHLVRDRQLPSLNPSNPRTEVLQRAWRRLPPRLAVSLGGLGSRYLP